MRIRDGGWLGCGVAKNEWCVLRLAHVDRETFVAIEAHLLFLAVLPPSY